MFMFPCLPALYNLMETEEEWTIVTHRLALPQVKTGARDGKRTNEIAPIGDIRARGGEEKKRKPAREEKKRSTEMSNVQQPNMKW